MDEFIKESSSIKDNPFVAFLFYQRDYLNKVCDSIDLAVDSDEIESDDLYYHFVEFKRRERLGVNNMIESRVEEELKEIEKNKTPIKQKKSGNKKLLP